MAKLSINLKIAGGTYPFEIDGAKEELYRQAEREVNRLFAVGANTTLLPKDRLALAALQLAMENLQMRSAGADAELARVGERLEEYFKEHH